jgi:hypothetical protein
VNLSARPGLLLKCPRPAWIVFPVMTTTNTQAEEIGLRVLMGVHGTVKSIDGGYDCVYIETEDGKVYAVNVTECEEVD